jgi:hypothetical protein
MNVTVAGPATAEELAAVLAVLTGRSASAPPPSRYDQWRAGRQHAVRRVVSADDRPI